MTTYDVTMSDRHNGRIVDAENAYDAAKLALGARLATIVPAAAPGDLWAFSCQAFERSGGELFMVPVSVRVYEAKKSSSTNQPTEVTQ